jgi:hypothetical protein
LVNGHLSLSPIVQPSPLDLHHHYYDVTINLVLEEMHAREDARVDGNGMVGSSSIDEAGCEEHGGKGVEEAGWRWKAEKIEREETE